MGYLLYAKYFVSWLLNFLVVTFPSSIPSRSQMRFPNAGFDEPAKTFIFDILFRISTKR